MKKTAVIIGSVVLFTLLVGFNYLMWENVSKAEDIRQLESETESKERNAEMLLNMYADLESSYQQVLLENQRLREQQNELADQIEEVRFNNNQYVNRIAEQNTLINELKKVVDNEEFVNILQDWIERINNRDYFIVHSMQGFRNVFENGDVFNYEDLVRQFEYVEEIELKNFNKKMYFPSIYEHNIELIQFDGIMNVTLTKEEVETDEGTRWLPMEHSYFNDGENAFTVTFEYNRTTQRFMISNIRIQ